MACNKGDDVSQMMRQLSSRGDSCSTGLYTVILELVFAGTRMTILIFGSGPSAEQPIMPGAGTVTKKPFMAQRPCLAFAWAAMATDAS